MVKGQKTASFQKEKHHEYKNKSNSFLALVVKFCVLFDYYNNSCCPLLEGRGGPR